MIIAPTIEPTTLQVTRRELEAFLPDHRTIRAFETMQTDLLSTYPGAFQEIVDAVNALLAAPVITYVGTDTFENERVPVDGEGIVYRVGPDNVTFNLEDLGLPPGVYGDAQYIPSLTLDKYGRATLATAYRLNSDNVLEGITNLFFTQARARASLSGGQNITYNSGTGVVAVDRVLDNGRYTPTATGLANVAAVTAFPAQWLRVGNTVTVSGRIDVQATVAGRVDVGLTLPVPSSLTVLDEMAGTVAAFTTNDNGVALYLTGSASPGLLIHASGTALDSYLYTYTYVVK